MTPTDALADELLRSAARLSRWASRHADLGMPYAQARVLALVDDLGPARVTTLAAADDCSQPSMTAQVHRLEADGLVARTPDPADARATLIGLTADGAAVPRPPAPRPRRRPGTPCWMPCTPTRGGCAMPSPCSASCSTRPGASPPPPTGRTH